MTKDTSEIATRSLLSVLEKQGVLASCEVYETRHGTTRPISRCVMVVPIGDSQCDAGKMIITFLARLVVDGFIELDELKEGFDGWDAPTCNTGPNFGN